jgi:uracil permease
MIAAIGIRTISESEIDLSVSRNLVVIALILGTGLGINTATYDFMTGSSNGIPLKIGDRVFGLSGLFVATIVGIIANLVFRAPTESDKKEEDQSEKDELEESNYALSSNPEDSTV